MLTTEVAWLVHARGKSELWAWDGSAAGTRRIGLVSERDRARVRVIAIERAPDGFLLVASSVGTGAGYGMELYLLDSLEGKARLLADLLGPRSINFNQGLPVTAGPGEVGYFVHSEPATGFELWRTDGTPSGTRLSADLTSGSASTYLYGLHAFGSRLLVWAQIGGAPPGLYGSDGTRVGTTLLQPDIARFQDFPPVQRGDRVWFLGNQASSAALWSTDGTASGTRRAVGTPGTIVEALAIGNRFYWITVAGTGGNRSRLLFESDGTSLGTRILAIAASWEEPGSSLHSLTEHGGNLWFVFSHTDRDMVMKWDQSSNTLVTTKLATPAPLRVVPKSMGSDGSNLYLVRGVSFGANSGLQSPKAEVMATDRSGRGMHVVLEVFIGRDQIAYVGKFQAVGGRAVFAVATDQDGAELWSSDGTRLGTHPLTTSLPGPASGYPGLFDGFVLPGAQRMLFAGQDREHGVELWQTDGTTAGTRLVADLEPGPVSSKPWCFGRVGTTVFFNADHGNAQGALWKLELAELGESLAESYGRGCTTISPLPAELEAEGLACLGNLGFSVHAHQAPANSPAAWIVGKQRALLTQGSCTLLVDSPWYVVTGTTDPNGSATLPLPIPGDPAFLGLELRVQAAFADGAALALSDGIRVLIGAR